MKIKTDFITNSSSSSFIVAVNKTATKDDIKNTIAENGELDSYIQDYGEYFRWEDDEEIENIREYILDTLTREVVESTKYSLELGDFLSFAIEGSSEADGILSSWLYSYGNIKNDILKIKAYS